MMATIDGGAERQALIGRVRGLLVAQRVAEAEQHLLSAQARSPGDLDILELLAEFYVEVQRPSDAAQVLARCIEADPGRTPAYFRLADILERLGRVPDIVALYTRLTEMQPDLAIAHFNHAVHLRRVGRREEAVVAYRRAIALHVDGVAEAWSNVGVILGELERHAEARDAFAQALAANPKWVPALYNMGLLHEEFGERDAALEQFQRILAIEPAYYLALVRIVFAQTLHDPADPLIDRVRAGLKRSDAAPATREALLFALGKALDDCGSYAEAFAAYQAGNTVARGRTRTYERATVDRDNDAICDSFAASWLERVAPVSSSPLLFVCGMFRSGTTLLEQMLGAHPALTPGGELGYFNVQLNGESSGFPRGTAVAEERTLLALGQGYLDYLEQRFPGARCVINKRPDTVRYLGLLHGLFPEARFIVMRRNPLDTCLSIFFEQLGDQLGYATDLEDTAHYLLGYRKLLQHWKTLFAARILEVEYEQLVSEPESELRRVCAFLGLPWDPGMMHSNVNPGRVRTASVWQVREAVHTRSIGRWRHYAPHIGAIEKMLGVGADGH